VDLLLEVFDADVAAVGNARGAVEEQLVAAGMEEFVDAARLVVDELVWNVVIHAGTKAVVRVATQERGGVTIDVADWGPGEPTLREPGPEDLTGRGLMIVNELSDAWGWYPTDGGKVTWAHLAPGVDVDRLGVVPGL
jgi:anti-sigma regulatory factor (Ser/Thr protein kinase)